MVSPEKLKTVTPQAYATLRLYIENGCYWTQRYIANGLDIANDVIQRNPGLADMAVTFFDYVPADSIPLAPAQEILDQFHPEMKEKGLLLADEDRPGWPTFYSRTTLIKALDAVTPPEVLAKIGKLDGPPDKAGSLGLSGAAVAEDDSQAAAGLALEWWAVALAAGGVLYWLGKTNFAGVVIGLLARRLLQALVAGGALVLFTEAASKMLQKLGDGAKAAASSLLPIALAGGGIATFVAFLLMRRRSTARRKALAAA
ncbi:hypothetical protein [Nannocystis pusilla]|uniref:hypothetical protein n=1 Tax=Nannocystis pusilla TaxID=889268 RepID=UPI003B806869